MAKHYSRFSSLEEKRNIKKATKFLLLTGVTIVLLFFFGLPLVIKFAAFLTDIRKTSTPIEKNDITPPAPPQLSNLPEATNETSLLVEGVSESGATVEIFLNDKKTEVIADEAGVFTTKLTLLDGENTIYALARDKAGNESQEAKKVVVVFDNEDPRLEVISPADGEEFFGSKNQKVTIEGVSEAGAALTINERFVGIGEDGSFSFPATLNEGENVFTLNALDKAGNATEKSLILRYTP